MKVSYKWLQKHIEETLPEPALLKEKIIFHAFEVESEERYGDDTIFDIKVLPDRAHDCLSHYGIAREIAGLYGYTLKPYTHDAISEAPLSFSVDIQHDACRRYLAVAIEGVTVGPSPTWLVEALSSIGARSINNVVDATNYVLFDRGQPIHAFDRKKIDGGIVVRTAHEHEQITTLSQEIKQLQQGDLVIADYLGVLAVAGVKGGVQAEVTNDTTSIVVEVANFDPTLVRKTSRRLGLVTDASKRFENDLSPEVAHDAMLHVVSLIKELAGGTVVGVQDYYPHRETQRTLSFTTKDIVRLLGDTISDTVIPSVLDRYHYQYTHTNDVWTLTIPFERTDIQGAHDIADEIGRVIGYDTIAEAVLPFTPITTPSEYEKVRAVKWWLAKNGFREVMTYSFRKKGDVIVARGPKDKSALRTTLSDGLKESYELNRLNAPLMGLDTIRLFEVGTVFFTDREELRVATADKGIFEELSLDAFMEKYNIDTSSVASSHFELSASNSFTPWSVYPFMVRDIAVWGDDTGALQALDTIVTTFATTYCVRPPVIFDRFEKDGKTSVAYRFVFQAFDKTLTEEEVSGWFSLLTKEVESQKGLSIR